MGNLTVVQCRTLPDGKHSDGDGLRLVVKNGGESRAWTLAYTSPTTGKRREIGLGKFSKEFGLAKAREAAKDRREEVRKRIDPIEAAAALKQQGADREAAAKEAAAIEHLTLRRATRAYHERIEATFRNPKHRQQWINSVEQHIPAAILDQPVATVTPAELLDVIQVLYVTLPETGRRVRQRLEAVFDDCALRGKCAGNPAAIIKRQLRSKRERGSFAALPYADVPALVARLRGLPGTAAAALTFAILTGARTGEVLGAKWDEIRGDVWTVPGTRMKGGEAHTVYLSDAAAAVLAKMRKAKPISHFVFTSPVDPKKPLSNMGMSMLLRRLKVDTLTTVHGLCRASFSTWANETAAARPDVIEACLAHKEGDRVRRAYNRSQFTDERRALLEKWAAFTSVAKRRKTV